MNKTIYYFTATGNSLQAAFDIADSLSDTEVISMSQAGMNLFCESEVIGFVFPSFAWGPPNMVKDFIKSGSFRKDAYIFIVVTCGSSMGGSAVIVDELLRAKGAKLSYVAQVRMVSNYIVMYNIATEKIAQTLSNAESALKPIIADIENRKTSKIKKGMDFIARQFHRKITAGYKNADKNYNVSDSCTGCGICASICPANNIEMAENKPTFKHNCEHCLACIHWCPVKAINYKDKTQKRDRYHHPKIKSEQLP